jgi:hypothetical protein
LDSAQLEVKVVCPLQLSLVQLPNILSVLQLVLPFLHKSVVGKRDAAAFTPHLLVVLPHLRFPALLGPEVIIRLVAEDLDRSNVEVHQDVAEGGPVTGLGRPALLHKELHTLRAGGGDRQLE